MKEKSLEKIKKVKTIKPKIKIIEKNKTRDSSKNSKKIDSAPQLQNKEENLLKKIETRKIKNTLEEKTENISKIKDNSEEIKTKKYKIRELTEKDWFYKPHESEFKEYSSFSPNQSNQEDYLKTTHRYNIEEETKKDFNSIRSLEIGLKEFDEENKLYMNKNSEMKDYSSQKYLLNREVKKRREAI